MKKRLLTWGALLVSLSIGMTVKADTTTSNTTSLQSATQVDSSSSYSETSSSNSSSSNTQQAILAAKKNTNEESSTVSHITKTTTKRAPYKYKKSKNDEQFITNEDLSQTWNKVDSTGNWSRILFSDFNGNETVFYARNGIFKRATFTDSDYLFEGKRMPKKLPSSVAKTDNHLFKDGSHLFYVINDLKILKLSNSYIDADTDYGANIDTQAVFDRLGRERRYSFIYKNKFVYLSTVGKYNQKGEATAATAQIKFGSHSVRVAMRLMKNKKIWLAINGKAYTLKNGQSQSITYLGASTVIKNVNGMPTIVDNSNNGSSTQNINTKVKENSIRSLKVEQKILPQSNEEKTINFSIFGIMLGLMLGLVGIQKRGNSN
ncbi:hypothetical protein C5L31_000194 [Secundilactobacillus malefermentans]|uniref:Gram-positive cocci surface proteins LPxTG domain-containing protein n=1 Tax=Secundilactobacillus malefermentans TaxID=176292 RepID=A0A4V3A3T0_9LACO|nr:LPXTG cell wall anchor domain-containing protein [Secundilactobacillus malefermentans]KRM57681.1 hypothetical protein FD44_GL001050 [Secundilactobacillus malefermentans DSM 5705 = KCTC 3548]TDG76641.1 hypothetical protein C5L31_000194 [Secundilactobacillus malefermentans]